MLFDWLSANGIALPFVFRTLILIVACSNTHGADYCQDDSRFAQFDFWVGDWQVYVNDRLVGQNTITKDANACVIREHWVNSGGTDGYSLRYFNPLAVKWQMLWVSDGYSVHTDGGEVRPGEMLLSGEIHYFETNLTTGFRVRFTDNPDGTVRQYAEQEDPETGAWTPWFDGVYRRKADRGK